MTIQNSTFISDFLCGTTIDRHNKPTQLYRQRKREQMAETQQPQPNPKDKPAGAGTGTGRKSIFLSWRLFLGLFMVALLIVSAISIVYDPKTTGPGGDITKSSFFLGITFTVGASWFVLEIVFKFLKPALPALWEKVQGLDKKTEAIKTVTQSNTDNIKDLGNAYKQLIDEYQQSKGETRGELNQLQRQVNTFMKENVELNRTIIKMERELADVKRKLTEAEIKHATDQNEITVLRAQMEDLRLEIAKLNATNEYLKSENRDLKTSIGRRSTDKLGGLSSEAEARYNDIEQQQQQEESERDK